MSQSASIERGFQIGHKIVAIDDPCDEVFEIERSGRYGELFDTRWRLLKTNLYRLATPKEIEANKRLQGAEK